MKTTKIFFAAALSALMLSACSSDDTALSQPAAEGEVPVQLTSSTVQAVAHRAATNLNETKLTSGDVSVFISTNYATQYTYTAQSDGSLTSASTAYYPNDGSEIDIAACYPASASSDASSAATFTVSENQSSDPQYIASDLLWAQATGKSKASGSVALAFQHKMAKIIVNVTAGSGVSTISTITLKNIKRRVSFTASTGVLGTAEEVDGSHTDVIVGGNNNAAVIPPQTLSGQFLTIVTDQGTATYSFASAKVVEAGNYYQLNITVNRTNVGVTNTIGAWTGSGTANVSLMRAARVGDLYFSDGSWGTASEFPDKTPIGIVFCTPTSAKDQALGYHQGYVMALKRANSGANVANWCAAALQSTKVTDVLYGSTDQPVQWGNITSDLDGLTHCNTATSTYTLSNLTAINAAKNYTPAAPTSTSYLPNSGWYLPSIGQQYQWLIAFASSGSYYDNIKNYGNWTWRSTYADFYLNNATYSDASGNTATAINTYINGKLSTSANQAHYESFAKGHYLWSSTERAEGYAFSLSFSTGGNLGLSGGAGKSSTYRQVRPVLAF